MRAPLTAMIFAIELSGRFALALPLLTAGMVAHGFTVLMLRAHPHREGRSARLSPHSRIQHRPARDPLRARGDASRGGGPAGRHASDARGGSACRNDPRPGTAALPGRRRRGRGWSACHPQQPPDLDERSGGAGHRRPIGDLVQQNPAVAYADEPLRLVVDRMAQSGLTRFPVVRRDRGWPEAARYGFALRSAQGADARILRPSTGANGSCPSTCVSPALPRRRRRRAFDSGVIPFSVRSALRRGSCGYTVGSRAGHPQGMSLQTRRRRKRRTPTRDVPTDVSQVRTEDTHKGCPTDVSQVRTERPLELTIHEGIIAARC